MQQKISNFLERLIHPTSIFSREYKISEEVFPPDLSDIPKDFKNLFRYLHGKNILAYFWFEELKRAWPKGYLFAIQDNLGNISSGYSINAAHAMIRATAEFLERHSLRVFDTRKFTLGSFASLKYQNALDPRRFIPFSASQQSADATQSKNINENTLFSWVPCRSLETNTEYLIPAQLTRLGYKTIPEELLIRQMTSNGAAAGYSLEMATYNGICELIERDAFMIFWLNKLSPPRIDMREVKSESCKKLLKKYSDYTLPVSIFDLTTDLEVPTIMIIIQNSGVHSFTIALKADLSLEKAIEGALNDSLRVGYVKNPESTEVFKAEDVVSIETRRRYWQNPSHHSLASFLTANLLTAPWKSTPEYTDMRVRLSILKQKLADKKVDVFIGDITHDIAKKYKLHVSIAVSPQLCPLYLNESFKYLGLKRLYEVPPKLGYRLKNEMEMNTIPHPFL